MLRSCFLQILFLLIAGCIQAGFVHAQETDVRKMVSTQPTKGKSGAASDNIMGKIDQSKGNRTIPPGLNVTQMVADEYQKTGKLNPYKIESKGNANAGKLTLGNTTNPAKKVINKKQSGPSKKLLRASSSTALPGNAAAGGVNKSETQKNISGSTSSTLPTAAGQKNIYESPTSQLGNGQTSSAGNLKATVANPPGKVAPSAAGNGYDRVTQPLIGGTQPIRQTGGNNYESPGSALGGKSSGNSPWPVNAAAGAQNPYGQLQLIKSNRSNGNGYDRVSQPLLQSNQKNNIQGQNIYESAGSKLGSQTGTLNAALPPVTDQKNSQKAPAPNGYGVLPQKRMEATGSNNYTPAPAKNNPNRAVNPPGYDVVPPERTSSKNPLPPGSGSAAKSPVGGIYAGFPANEANRNSATGKQNLPPGQSANNSNGLKRQNIYGNAPGSSTQNGAGSLKKVDGVNPPITSQKMQTKKKLSEQIKKSNQTKAQNIKRGKAGG